MYVSCIGTGTLTPLTPITLQELKISPGIIEHTFEGKRCHRLGMRIAHKTHVHIKNEN